MLNFAIKLLFYHPKWRRHSWWWRWWTWCWYNALQIIWRESFVLLFFRVLLPIFLWLFVLFYGWCLLFTPTIFMSFLLLLDCVCLCMCVNMFPVVADAAGWLFIYGGVLNEWKILWGDHNWLQKQKLSRISYFYETRKKTPSSSLNH